MSSIVLSESHSPCGFASLTASIGPDRALTLEQVDVGRSVTEGACGADREERVTVPAAAVDALLLALVAERFAAGPAQLLAYCRMHGIEACHARPQALPGVAR
jgi:hypothetical protein